MTHALVTLAEDKLAGVEEQGCYVTFLRWGRNRFACMCGSVHDCGCMIEGSVL